MKLSKGNGGQYPGQDGGRRKKVEDMSVFKSYLRRLLQDLKDLRDAIEKVETEKAKEMAEKLIEDTQKGIEDD